MLRKIILIVGILGALAAAEGLNRFGGLVSVFGGADAPFYMVMLVVSVIGAGRLAVGARWEIQSHREVGHLRRLYWLHPLDGERAGFPVSVQIIFGLIVAAGATVWIRPAT